MSKIAFGPMVNLPSTVWVGRDVAEYIDASNNDVHVELFNNFEYLPDVDVIFIIKLMPPLHWLLSAKKKNTRVLYFPIDYFHHPALFYKEQVKLELFDCILLHNERLLRNLPRSVEHIAFVDHYLKYHLPFSKRYSEDGFILWVGHIEYLPPLIKALSQHNLPHPLRVLTDLENLRVKTDILKTRLTQAGLSFSLELCGENIVLNGVKLEQWTAKKQEQYMLTCKAAFDTKNDGFAHNLKPPTKAQKYVFNGIPFAISEHAYAYEYFLNKGLKLATLETPERWLSKEYFDEVNDFKNKYGHTQTLECIGKRYLVEAQNSVNRLSFKKVTPWFVLNCRLQDLKNNVIYVVRRALEKLKKSVVSK